MNVKELISKLQTMPQDSLVLICTGHNGRNSPYEEIEEVYEVPDNIVLIRPVLGAINTFIRK